MLLSNISTVRFVILDLPRIKISLFKWFLFHCGNPRLDQRRREAHWIDICGWLGVVLESRALCSRIASGCRLCRRKSAKDQSHFGRGQSCAGHRWTSLLQSRLCRLDPRKRSQSPIPIVELEARVTWTLRSNSLYKEYLHGYGYNGIYPLFARTRTQLFCTRDPRAQQTKHMHII